MWYCLCSRYGTRLLHMRAFRRLVHPRRLLEVKHQMDRRGAWIIVVARFLPGSRTSAITVAGILHMPFWKFLTATACCVMITAPIQLGIGILGARMLGVRDTAEMLQAVVGLMLLAMATMGAIRLLRRHRRSHRRPPRAKARWLRHFRVPGISRRKPGGVKEA
jgi:membrane protein DedA with SNARE-associated domain